MHCRYLRFDRRECRLEKQSRRGGYEILHAMNVIKSGGDVAICYPSGDTDIMVLALAWYHGIPLLEMITFQPFFVRGKTLLVNNEE